MLFRAYARDYHTGVWTKPPPGLAVQRAIIRMLNRSGSSAVDLAPLVKNGAKCFSPNPNRGAERCPVMGGCARRKPTSWPFTSTSNSAPCALTQACSLGRTIYHTAMQTAARDPPNLEIIFSNLYWRLADYYFTLSIVCSKPLLDYPRTFERHPPCQCHARQTLARSP